MDHVCTWRGEVWFGVRVIFLCAYFIGKIDFTWKHKPALCLIAWLHKDNSVYNTSWVSRSIHPTAIQYTGRATLGHIRRTTLSVFGDPVLRVCATRRHLHHYVKPRLSHYCQCYANRFVFLSDNVIQSIPMSNILTMCAVVFSQFLFIQDKFVFFSFINLQVERTLDKCYNEP